MAYAAMSRVRTLQGLHLTAFDPKSIIVENSCLEEVNRLRSLYRKDLPLYEIPIKKNNRLNVICYIKILQLRKSQNLKQNQMQMNIFQRAPRSVKLQVKMKTVQLWLLRDLLHHNMNG